MKKPKQSGRELLQSLPKTKAVTPEGQGLPYDWLELDLHNALLACRYMAKTRSFNPIKSKLDSVEG